MWEYDCYGRLTKLDRITEFLIFIAVLSAVFYGFTEGEKYILSFFFHSI